MGTSPKCLERRRLHIRSSQSAVGWIPVRLSYWSVPLSSKIHYRDDILSLRSSLLHTSSQWTSHAKPVAPPMWLYSSRALYGGMRHCIKALDTQKYIAPTRRRRPSNTGSHSMQPPHPAQRWKGRTGSRMILSSRHKRGGKLGVPKFPYGGVVPF